MKSILSIGPKVNQKSTLSPLPMPGSGEGWKKGLEAVPGIPVTISLGILDTGCITLDTVKVGFHGSPKRILDKSLFKLLEEKDFHELAGMVSVGKRWIYKGPKIAGLSRLEFREEGGYIIGGVIEGSAKALLKDYLSGIHSGNIGAWIDAVFYTVGGIEHDSILKGSVYRADHVKTFPIDAPFKEYIDACSMLRPVGGWGMKPYQYEGMSLIRDVKTSTLKDRAIIYEKRQEIAKDKNLSNLIHVDRELMRVEINPRHFEQVRRLYGLTAGERPTLSAVLQSRSNPALDVFNRAYPMKGRAIEKDAPEECELFIDEIENNPDYQGQNLWKLEKGLGREHIVRGCGFDLEKVMIIVSRRVNGNVSKYKREYRELIEKMLTRSVGKNGTIYREHIEEIRARLSA